MAKARTAKIISFVCQHCNEENHLNLQTGEVEAIYRRSTQKSQGDPGPTNETDDPGSDVSGNDKGAAESDREAKKTGAEDPGRETFGKQLSRWLGEGEDLFSDKDDQSGAEETEEEDK